MELDKIRELIKMVEESSFDEFSYAEGETSITFKRNPQVSGEPVSAARSGFNEEVFEEKPAEDDEFEFIISPMVGTFYSAPAPDAPAFAAVGDRLMPGDTVCIIEAMKLMNEIECPYEAEIVSVIVSNEQKVEYGQPLFKIKKL